MLVDTPVVEQSLTACPERVAIVGGGRWTRVLVDVLQALLPSEVPIVVHTVRGAGSMAAWLDERGLHRRVQVTAAWPQAVASGSVAVVVANAAGEHEQAAAHALAAGAPTLVEKPIALTASGARRLCDLARDRGARLAAAHVFRFAAYLENFVALVRQFGRVQSAEIVWTDPEHEVRDHGRKAFDSSLPAYADWLPHGVSLVGDLLPGLPDRLDRLALRRGGAGVDLELRSHGVPCSLRLERNAARRQRVLRATVDDEQFELDFSMEPGTIRRGDRGTRPADPQWETRPRPLATMLRAFLTWASGGARDRRLDVAPALAACELADQAARPYRSKQVAWVVRGLSSDDPVSSDLRYALTELLQAGGRIDADGLDRQLRQLINAFSGEQRRDWSRALRQARDPIALLRSLGAQLPS